MIRPRTSSTVASSAALVTASVVVIAMSIAISSQPLDPTTSVLVVALIVAGAANVWQYRARLHAEHERQQARAELEQSVTDRTGELCARNEALRVSEDSLLSADRRKDEFMATLSHELRGPLAPIRNAVAVLRDSSITQEDGERARAMIDRQVGQISRLVDDLLDVSRLTTGKLSLNRRPVALNGVISLAVDTVRPHFDRANQRVTVWLPRERIVLDADETRLVQMLVNLLHNACKFTDPGGAIQVTAALVNEREVTVTIRDNGIGIPEEFLPKLFAKFTQVDAARDRSQGGLGLGLSLVQGIAALHGGRVEARSAGVGRGSEFIVHLPVSEVSQPEVKIERKLPAASEPAARRVLVVDDNVDSANSLALLLRLQGHRVETAYNGVEAIDIAARFHPEAVLLDLGLPGLNGYEVCRRLRAGNPENPALIIAQTGWGQAQDRERALAAGFDAHLTKPIDPDVVHHMIAGDASRRVVS